VIRSPELRFRIVVAAAVLVALVWILLPNMVIDYLDPCTQSFLAAVSSVRDVSGRYPASLNEVEHYLEMEAQTSCSIKTVAGGQYYVAWQQPRHDVCRLMVAYRVDAAGNLEEYNVHRVAREPD